MALRQRFIGSKQPPATFVEEARRLAPAPPKVHNVDHTTRVTNELRVSPSKFAIHFVLCSEPLDSLISQQTLSGFKQARDIVVRLLRQSPDNATLQKDLLWFDEQIATLRR